MQGDFVPDSEDDEFFSPWLRSPLSSSPAGVSTRRNRRASHGGRSPSSDELAIDFEVSHADSGLPGVDHEAVASTHQILPIRPADVIGSGDQEADLSQALGTPNRLIPEDVTLRDAIETPPMQGSSRQLRPRTYQQLHTYEYEHAKYVMECRAAGIKPVRFDGSRYREMDKADKDFIPPKPTRVAREGFIVDETFNSSGEVLSRLDDAGLNSGKKRKRSTKTMRFRDPRDYDPTMQQQSQGEEALMEKDLDIFDFLDDHWHERRHSSTHSSPRDGKISGAEKFSTAASSGSSSVSDDPEDEAAAKAVFARKLRGILPPSYLSRDKATHVSKPSKAQHHRRITDPQSPQIATKGVAKKRISDNIGGLPRFNSLGNSMSVPVEVTDALLKLGAAASDFKDPRQASEYEVDSDISEGEEPIDRLLTRPINPFSKPKYSKFSASKRLTIPRRRAIAQPIYLQDVVADMTRGAAPQDLRLACRTVRKKKSGGTQLGRKQLFFHDSAARNSKTSQKIKEGRVDTEESDDPIETLHKWKSLSLPFLGRTSEPVNKRFSSRPPKRAPKHCITTNQSRFNSLAKDPRATIMENTSFKAPSISLSRTSSDLDSSNQFLDEDDSDETRVSINVISLARPDPAGPAVRRDSKKKLPSQIGIYAARTYQDNVEHESGRYAVTDRRTRTRKRVPIYLQRFDQITNLFGEDPSHMLKVSDWQRAQLRQSPKHANNPTDAVHAQCAVPVPRKVARKNPAKRSHTARQILLPFTTLVGESDLDTLEHSRQTGPMFQNTMSESSFGCKPLEEGVHFSQKTFVGNGGLIGLLEARSVYTRPCLVGEHHLTGEGDVGNALSYGFNYVETIFRGQINDHSERPVDLTVYDFLRHASSLTDQASLQKSLEHLRNLRSEFMLHDWIASTAFRTYMTWLTMFFLITATTYYILVADEKPVKQRILKDAQLSAYQFVTSVGNGTVVAALSRHREELHRRQGISYVMDDAVLELCVVYYHITQTIQTSFWGSINDVINLSSAPTGLKSTEDQWSTIFMWTTITQFGIKGQLTREVPANWEAVTMLLEQLVPHYQQSTSLHNAMFDRYTKIVLNRTLELISVWHWPGSSMLLGHGRSGGILYDLFFKTLHLCCLPTEKQEPICMPLFLRTLQNLDCLRTDLDTENSFGMFLKVVCIGIRSYLKHLDLSGQDLERTKRRGIGVVDKFATLGRLNYLATESINQETVIEIQNRYSLEIAVYWTAGPWKDRGMSRMIQAAIEAMPASHLRLREINLQAWKVVLKINLQNSEDDVLAESMSWLLSIVQAYVSDVLQFRHQSRLNTNDAKLQSQLDKNLKKCLDSLLATYKAYHSMLENPKSSVNARRISLIWSNDILKPVLQLHESFQIGRQNHILDQVFQIGSLLVSHVKDLWQAEDTQDYGMSGFSQDETDAVDYDKAVHVGLQEFVGLSFQCLTNLSSQDRITSSSKMAAKASLQSFTSAILCLQDRSSFPWSDLFDSHGPYSWNRLMNGPNKAVMQPYYLALLVEKSTSFYQNMRSHVLAAWVMAMTDRTIRDSLATLTTVLVNGVDSDLFQHVDELHLTRGQAQHRIDSNRLEKCRTDLIISFIREVGSSFQRRESGIQELLPRHQIASLTQALKQNYQRQCELDRDVLQYTGFIHQLLSSLHQYCTYVLRGMSGDELESFDWLHDSKNIPQIRNDFAPDTFRAFATEDLDRKALEIALIVTARCDADILDERHYLSDFLASALANGSTDVVTAWDPDVARLRVFVVSKLFVAFIRLQPRFVAASLYIAALRSAIASVYTRLLTQSWSGKKTQIDALASEALTVLSLLPETYTTSVRRVLERMIRHLSGYTCLNADLRVRIRQRLGAFAPQPGPGEEHCSPAIETALGNNMRTNWVVTPDSRLFHTRRRVTMSIPILPDSDEDRREEGEEEEAWTSTTGVLAVESGDGGASEGGMETLWSLHL